jgi:hypothetical protein
VQAGDGKDVFLKIGQRLAFEALAFITPHSKPDPQVWLFQAFSFLLTLPEIAGIFRISAIGLKDGE